MTEIALYDTLRKIPDVSDAEAKEAVAGVASSREMATKADIKDMATKTDLANLETRLTQRIYAAVGIVLAGVGLMIKFL